MIRNTGYDLHSWTETFLGSYPSFIFVLGGAVIIKRLRNRLTFKTLTTFTAGAITYEWSQRYTNGVFDLNDCIAIGLAAAILYSLIHVGFGEVPRKNEEKTPELSSN
ncbi:hypothetical protein [Alteromonas sp. H39]|uniref:hypothetical protein n=1 Tax=Alteromonas sp. H39 TaxID=3389876 RepID=UPI0039E08EFE